MPRVHVSSNNNRRRDFNVDPFVGRITVGDHYSWLERKPSLEVAPTTKSRHYRLKFRTAF